MALRAEEKLAAERFEKWLVQVGLKVEWRAVEPDPPDLCFKVQLGDAEPEEWAVEVTGLFQYADWDNKEGNIRNVQAPLQRMCQNLSDAIKGQVITGYLISGSGPFDARLKVIEERALQYIKSEKTEREYLDLEEARAEFQHILDSHPENAKLQDTVQAMAENKSRFFIQAVTAPIKISWMAGLDGSSNIPDGTAMIADIMATLEYAIGRILDAKLPRVKNLAGYRRKLILIWSGYFFAESERISEILSKRNLTSDDIDSIVLIDSSAKVDWVADPAGVFRPPA